MELFSFQDLMSFGMFMIALLTFIVLNNKKQLLHRKTALTLWPSDRAEFPSLPIGQTTLWAVVLFQFQYTTIHAFVQQQKVIRAQKNHPYILWQVSGWLSTPNILATHLVGGSPSSFLIYHYSRFCATTKLSLLLLYNIILHSKTFADVTLKHVTKHKKGPLNRLLINLLHIKRPLQ